MPPAQPPVIQTAAVIIFTPQKFRDDPFFSAFIRLGLPRPKKLEFTPRKIRDYFKEYTTKQQKARLWLCIIIVAFSSSFLSTRIRKRKNFYCSILLSLPLSLTFSLSLRLTHTHILSLYLLFIYLPFFLPADKIKNIRSSRNVLGKKWDTMNIIGSSFPAS